MSISLKIKEVRNKKKLSQKRFGYKIGLSGKTISAYENGRCKPPLKVLERISTVYDTPFVHLKTEKKLELEYEIEEFVRESLSL